MRFLLEQEG
jgi:hypothetical protein